MSRSYRKPIKKHKSKNLDIYNKRSRRIINTQVKNLDKLMDINEYELENIKSLKNKVNKDEDIESDFNLLNNPFDQRIIKLKRK